MRVAIAIVRIAIGRMAIAVVRVAIVRLDAVSSELRPVARGRQTIRGLKIPHKVTLVGQADAKTNLLHAEKARLEQIFGPLHAQHSQIPHRRHTDVGFEQVAQSPNGKVYGLCEFTKGEFSTDVVAHHFDDFLYSFIQGSTLWGDVF